MYQERIIIDGLQYCNWTRSYFKELKASGVTAIHATLAYHENARDTLTRFSEWNLHFELNADLIMPVLSAGDIERAKSLGKVGVILGAKTVHLLMTKLG
ncbi:microsomal dipeptidase [Vibrio ponticus]|nr:microsomal dipeptidase [Vibrio ponticus]